MLTRRDILKTTAVMAATVPLQSCSSQPPAGYTAAVAETWRHTRGTISSRQALLREIVRYATLAPSSHNSQCWRFRIADDTIIIAPDLARRCPVVDPDNHHLFVSLGCAAETIVQAAAAGGLAGEVRFGVAGPDAVSVALSVSVPSTPTLFDATLRRQCTRAEFDGLPIAADELRRLEILGTGQGVTPLFITARPAMEQVLETIVAGNSAQLGDPAFVAELQQWIRFSDEEALAARDGLYSRAAGNPAVPRWLGTRLFGVVASAGRDNDKHARHVRSSAGLVVFTSEVDDKAHWVEAGRCYTRFALLATALDIRNAFLNQPVEVAALRPQFAAHLGLGKRRPDLVVRFGHGPELPRSLRRPVEAVLA